MCLLFSLSIFERLLENICDLCTLLYLYGLSIYLSFVAR
jgi:hypothetical protein